MSAKGSCYDNVVVESFFGSLKTELVYLKQFKTRTEAKQAIHEFKVLKRSPHDWEMVTSNARLSKNGEELGVRFIKPHTNNGTVVRIMPGNANSPYSTSRSTYVALHKDGGRFDKFGNRLNSEYCDEAHIPFEEFIHLPEGF